MLIEDAVYAAVESAELRHGVYFIKSDVELRGLSKKLGKQGKLIDYDELVAMCVAADHIKNWF